MKIVIVGGHLSPALAVIEELSSQARPGFARPKGEELLFIGRKYTFEGDRATSLEHNTIGTLKIPFVGVSTGRLQRRFTRFTIPSLFKIPYGFVQSFFILKNFKPDVVLSFGGYLSIPVGLSAFFLRIPIVIHEQTLEVGLSNRILSFFANKICISWESSRKFFPQGKTVFTGNPIRNFGLSLRGSRLAGDEAILINKRLFLRQLADRNDKGSKTSPIIYITGGSTGSHFINVLVEGCIKELLEKFVIIHQTGDAQEYSDFDRLSDFKDSLAARLKARYHLVKFVEPQEVGSVLQRADLVVGRSGINTVTELMFFKKPALLIPLPYSQNNEQIKNALFLKDKGLGEIFYQEVRLPQNNHDSLGNQTSLEFLKVLRRMFDNIDKYRAKYKLEGFTYKAAEKIVEVVNYEAKFKKKQTW